MGTGRSRSSEKVNAKSFIRGPNSEMGNRNRIGKHGFCRPLMAERKVRNEVGSPKSR